MANSTGTSISALITEGLDLGKIWKSKVAAERKSFTQDTKEGGFDMRLGKLIQTLKSQAEKKGQISRQVLTAHGIYAIDKRRRSEALWFVENHALALELIESSKKGFTSLSALQRAAREAAKANTSSKEEDTNSEADNSEAERSDVGPSEDKPKVVVTKTLLVNTILQQAEINKIDLEEVIMDLMEAQERKNQLLRKMVAA